jgi:membrane-associated phospholipid phosphatase
MVGRARPRLLFEQGLYGLQPFSHGWAWESFPSGHSSAAFAAATALVVMAPRYDLLWLLVAVLVAASRVATTVHYFSDVVAGGWLGVVGAVLVVRLLRRRGAMP